MTISVTVVNDQTQKSAVYFDRPDLDRYTVRITSDSATPVNVTTVQVKFPVTIFAVDTVAQMTVSTAGWTKQAAGPRLTLTPTGSLTLSSSAPLTIGLAGVKSNITAATNDDLQVFVGGQAPKTKIFLMRYPAAAADLTDAILPEIRPDTIYQTPSNFDKIVNVLTLRLINKNHDQPLITTRWTRTPSVRLSFVYGNDIGSLTPADAPASDPNSAFNIAVDAAATYKDGKQTFEWTVVPPDSGATDDPSPVWLLRPTPENRSVLGTGSGATAEFRISGISTSAPAGSTQIYLQFTDFPGYNDGFLTLALSKDEPEPAIVYFDGVPNYVAVLGDKVTLQWQTAKMSRVELQVGGTSVGDPLNAVHGSYPVAIDRTTDFALNAYTRADDTVPAHTKQWTGHVPDAQATLSADKSTVADGSPLVVSWSTRFARTAEIRSDTIYPIDQKSLGDGSRTYYPRQLTTYTLHVTGQGNPPDSSVNVFVLQRDWSSRRMGFSPHAGRGPVLYGTDTGLVLVGGGSDNAVFQSEDGKQWDQIAVAQFPARNDAAGCSLGGKLWIMGGLCGGQPANDVWSSSDGGATWAQVVRAAPWAARSSFACVAFKEKLWIFGGQDQNLQPLADAWSSADGATWTRATDGAPRWSARSGTAVAQHDGKLWLYGGLLADRTLAGDLWVSEDGATWAVASSGDQFNGVSGRQRAALGSLGGSLYLFGGIDAQGAPLNDFNIFDGSGWDLDTGPSGWAISRPGFTIWRGAFWFAGGLDGNADSDKVWSWFPG